MYKSRLLSRLINYVRGNMREFELLPNEEQIRDMAREYNMVRIRKDLYQGYKTVSDASQEVCATVDRSTKPVREVGNANYQTNFTGNGSKNNGAHGNIAVVEKQTFATVEAASRPITPTFVVDEVSPMMNNCPSGDCQAVRESNLKVGDCACGNDDKIPCANNKVAIACIEKCYYLQRDIEQAMLRLHTVAPPIYRNNIAELIKIKKENTQCILNTYMQLANQALDYSPTLYNGRNFCATLAVVSELQDKLLAKLARVEECTQLMWVTSREIILATALNRMCIFCYFNKL